MSHFVRRLLIVLCIAQTWSVSSTSEANDRPNVLFIAVDDLNDWIGCLGGHPQTLTPNIDRLAASGVLFTNAHCAAPACNPSRTAIFTGISPHVSGMYENGQAMRDVLPDAVLLPKHFSNHGYWSAGSGKLLHYFIEPSSWDDYFPNKAADNPFPRTLYPETRPLSLPRGGPWQYVETDWGPLDATDEQFGGDWLVSDWIGKQLSKDHAKPFFLACGIYRPHEPWFVPKTYFDAFPIEDIQLPPGYLEDDLDDVPRLGQSMARNRYFAHIREQGQWKQAIQGYLASIYFADTMVGRVIDALEAGPNADNTIVVLWSDHGWQLGEKEHWQKYTPWRAVTRVPLIIRAPEGTPRLAEGTRTHQFCRHPVNLVSLSPTLTALAGIAPQPRAESPSLVPLLKSPDADWPHVSITYTGKVNRYAISGEDYRYIHYEDGSEELYDIAKDPFEWTNLAGSPKHKNTLVELRATAPKKIAERPPTRVASLPSLRWQPAINESKVPPSRPDGSPFDVVFVNESDEPVRLFWMRPDGQRHTPAYATIAPGTQKRQRTRPGAVWLLTDKNETPLGHFTVGDRTARAIIPAK